jgi:hypothetical protein
VHGRLLVVLARRRVAERAAVSPGEPGRNRATSSMAAPVRFGARAAARRSAFAGTPRTTNRSPRSQACTMRRAARPASIVRTGRLAATEKSDASSSRRPFTSACRKEPVRMSPGTMVVTTTPSFAASAATPVEKPTAANFALV